NAEIKFLPETLIHRNADTHTRGAIRIKRRNLRLLDGWAMGDLKTSEKSFRPMEDKIFLGKYRVALDALGSPTELRDHPLLLEADDIVAEKKVSLELVPAASLRPAELEHLEAEAAAAKKLDHINIPAVLDFAIEDDQLVYVTEYIDGTSAEE